MTEVNVGTAANDGTGDPLRTAFIKINADITTLTSDVALKAPIASPTFTGTVGGITKAMVGLTNADNTSDMNKPISTAQQSALDLKADEVDLQQEVTDRTTITRLFEVNDNPNWIMTVTGEDSLAAEHIIGGVTTGGVLNFRNMLADEITTDTVKFPDGSEVYVYETLDDTAIIFVTDSEGRIISKVGSSAAPGLATYPVDDILFYQPNITMDGTSDESTRLKLAHDAAAAAGLRHLFIEGPIYAPTALFLGDVHFLTRSGLGRLVGTYRKRVVPISAPTFVPQSRVFSERHLKRLRTKLATASASDPAIIVYMSDSWGQPNQLIGRQSQFEEILRHELVAQFGADAAKIRVVNRALGGTTWTDAAGTVTQFAQSWATGVNLAWTSYVTTVQQADLTPTGRTPDVVIFMFGQNHATPMTPTEIGNMRSVVAAIEAVTPTPDILFVTSPTPATMSPTRGTEASLESKTALAGYTRGYAAMNGHGLIDFGRAYDALHWGQDPEALSWRRIGAPGSVTLPWVFPQAVYDYGIDLTVTGSSATFFTSGPLTFPLSPTAGNAFILEREAGGNLAYTINAATGQTSVARTITSVIATGSDQLLTISVLGQHLHVEWNGTQVFTGPVDRNRAKFTPTVQMGSSIAASVTSAYVSDSRSTMPSMTDAELWGDPSGDIGGNEENHLTEPGRTAIMRAVLSATRFS